MSDDITITIEGTPQNDIVCIIYPTKKIRDDHLYNLTLRAAIEEGVAVISQNQKGTEIIGLGVQSVYQINDEYHVKALSANMPKFKRVIGLPDMEDIAPPANGDQGNAGPGNPQDGGETAIHLDSCLVKATYTKKEWTKHCGFKPSPARTSRSRKILPQSLKPGIKRLINSISRRT